jgi:hypothetical protein
MSSTRASFAFTLILMGLSSGAACFGLARGRSAQNHS